MPLPLSRSQIEKLGKRLVAAERPAPEDLLALNELQIAYRDVLAAAVERVEAVVPYQPTSRVKTQGTTLDKLRLNGGSWLSAIQDLAGMRIVANVDRAGQDKIVARLRAAFAEETKSPKLIDRRSAPSSGYRAVHLVVYPDGVPVEIQVRTLWQHEWADLYEKLADRVGRGIRYGEPPEHKWSTAQSALADVWGSQPAPEFLERAAALRETEFRIRTLTVGHAQSVGRLIAEFEESAVTAAGSREVNQLGESVVAALVELRTSIDQVDD